MSENTGSVRELAVLIDHHHAIDHIRALEAEVARMNDELADARLRAISDYAGEIARLRGALDQSNESVRLLLAEQPGLQRDAFIEGREDGTPLRGHALLDLLTEALARYPGKKR